MMDDLSGSYIFSWTACVIQIAEDGLSSFSY